MENDFQGRTLTLAHVLVFRVELPRRDNWTWQTSPSRPSRKIVIEGQIGRWLDTVAENKWSLLKKKKRKTSETGLGASGQFCWMLNLSAYVNRWLWIVSNPRLSKNICIVFYRCGVSFNTVLCEEKRFQMFSEAASQRHKQVRQRFGCSSFTGK